MGDKSRIEWTEATWNPVRGCAIVSKGCTNCYAMRQAHRSSGPGRAYEGLTRMTNAGPVWTGDVREVEELLEQPASWRTPRRIFVNSMSDLFHEGVDDYFLDQVFAVMAMTPRHTYQVLTKRHQRMEQYIAGGGRAASVFSIVRNSELGYRLDGEKLPPLSWPLKNVWLGVSTEDQAAADVRIPALLRTPAAVRWISAEPLLGPIDLGKWIGEGHCDAAADGVHCVHWWDDDGHPCCRCRQLGTIGWAVVGGESGPGARPADPAWFRSLRDQCASAGVPFFFKQHGNWIECESEIHADELGRHVIPITVVDGQRCDDEAALSRMAEADRGFKVIEAHGKEFVNVGKKIAGRELDGKVHVEYPA